MSPNCLLFFTCVDLSQCNFGVGPRFVCSVVVRRGDVLLSLCWLCFPCVYDVRRARRVFGSRGGGAVERCRVVVGALASLEFVFTVVIFKTRYCIVSGIFGARFFGRKFMNIDFFFILDNFVVTCGCRRGLGSGGVSGHAF